MPNEVLEVLEGPAIGRQIAIGDELIIGRGSDETGRLADDPELSRRHARISPDAEGVLTVEDMGSTNGTFVNGERISGSRRLPTTFSTVPSFDAPPSQYDTVASTAPYQEPPPHHATPVQPRQEEPQPQRSTGRLAALVAIPMLLLAAAVVAVIALGGGDEEPASADSKNGQSAASGLSVAELASKAEDASVEINVSGPRYDVDKERDVNAKDGATGVVVDAKEGLVLTNAHVVSGMTSIKAQLADGTEASATIEGEAPCEDLAVIRLRPVPDGLTAVTFGDSDATKIGDRIVAAGYPGAFTTDLDKREFQATDGTVSQTSAVIEGEALTPESPDALQHQAPLRPGMSGGPLLSENGELIGLNTFSSTDDRTQNLNGAITSKRIEQLLKDLKAGKNTGYVGWTDFDLVPYGDRDALVVGRVKSGSPADKREIDGGEVIIKLDGTPIASVPEMCSILNSKSSGDNLEVQSIPSSVWARMPANADVGKYLKSQPTPEKNLTLE